MSRARAGAVTSLTALDVFALVSLANGNFPLTPATVNQAGFNFFFCHPTLDRNLYIWKRIGAVMTSSMTSKAYGS